MSPAPETRSRPRCEPGQTRFRRGRVQHSSIVNDAAGQSGFDQIPAEIVLVDGNRIVTDSRKVAKAFGKAHRNVLRAIKLLECSARFTALNFEFCSEVSELQNGKHNPYCRMTKDGFMFLVMGFTGQKAASIKEAFIDAFNAMADFIRLQAAGAWEQFNAAYLEHLSSKRHVSGCARVMRHWQDLKPAQLAQLEHLHPQLPLPIR